MVVFDVQVANCGFEARADIVDGDEGGVDLTGHGVESDEALARSTVDAVEFTTDVQDSVGGFESPDDIVEGRSPGGDVLPGVHVERCDETLIPTGAPSKGCATTWVNEPATKPAYRSGRSPEPSRIDSKLLRGVAGDPSGRGGIRAQRVRVDG